MAVDRRTHSLGAGAVRRPEQAGNVVERNEPVTLAAKVAQQFIEERRRDLETLVGCERIGHGRRDAMKRQDGAQATRPGRDQPGEARPVESRQTRADHLVFGRDHAGIPLERLRP